MSDENVKKIFAQELVAQASIYDAQFQLEGKLQFRSALVWGNITNIAELGPIVITLTNSALDAVDKIIDIIAKVRKGRLVPLKIICPDGISSIELESREKDIPKTVEDILRRCPGQRAA